MVRLSMEFIYILLLADDRVKSQLLLFKFCRFNEIKMNSMLSAVSC